MGPAARRQSVFAWYSPAFLCLTREKSLCGIYGLCEVSRLFLRRCFVFKHLQRKQYLSVPIVWIRFLFAMLPDETGFGGRHRLGGRRRRARGLFISSVPFPQRPKKRCHSESAQADEESAFSRHPARLNARAQSACEDFGSGAECSRTRT